MTNPNAREILLDDLIAAARADLDKLVPAGEQTVEQLAAAAAAELGR